ncbi:hypothetical protein [Alitabrizicola rongguiensis]|uniref:hypothetical protein n=1 Tax=Alitabrizicola rongguiensis TaxID=2909234 RepID=UPI001F214F62|nr:hypothetical protein [Tabrizicola rongguiensis]
MRGWLLAIAHFPNSLYDAELFFWLWQNEQERMRDCREEYTESEVFRAASNRLKKRRGQGAVTGLVAISYLFLKDRGLRPSLEKASRIASEVIYLSGEGSVLGTPDTFAMVGDQASVKAAFRANRSVAHIWATELCFRPPRIEQQQESSILLDELSYYWSAKVFQERIEAATDTRDWLVWSLSGVEPLELEQATTYDERSGPIDVIEQAFESLSS